MMLNLFLNKIGKEVRTKVTRSHFDNYSLSYLNVINVIDKEKKK